MIDGINIPEYEVTQFNQKIKDVVESNFTYVRIRGEVSQLKSASSGHIYLTLKDENSVLNATIWSQKKNYLQIQPEVGMEVIVTGKISTYAKSISTYSINIDRIELAGEGALLKLIEDRKKRLKSKGIFDEEHKKQIPFLSSKIGVITSAEGSVIHDIINRVKDRFPTNIDLWPVPVQGVEAPEKIIEAIEGFNSSKYKLNPDVIIIARGGGSTEDLMAFNDEDLAIKVFESKIPIVSAIGHETDTTIIDLVSDLRASTPTAAAEKVIPVKYEIEEKIKNFSFKLDNKLRFKIESIKDNFEYLNKTLKAPNFIINLYNSKIIETFKKLEFSIKNKLNLINLNFKSIGKSISSPDSLIKIKQISIIEISKNLENNINERYLNYNNNLKSNIRLLNSNSISANLKKGYSILTNKQKIIKSIKGTRINTSIKAKLKDGSLDLDIKKIN